MLFAVFLTVWGCQEEATLERPAPEKNEPVSYVESGRSDLDGEIRDNLEMIRLGLLNLTGNPEFKEALFEVLSVNGEGEGFFATFLEIEEVLSPTGFSAVDLIIDSFLDNGGTAEEVEELTNMLFSMKVGGKVFTPRVFVPFGDVSAEYEPSWDGVSADYVGTDYSFDDSGIEVLSSDGGSSWLDESEAESRAIWFVSLEDPDPSTEPSALRHWARCSCERKMDASFECRPGSHAFGRGSCRRTGWGNDICGGSADDCTDTPGGQ